MSKQVFKKAASHATLSFLLCIDRCEMKNLQPLLLFFADENEKLSINEVLEVLISVGTFTSTISFDTQSLQFVTMNKLKKVCQEGCNLLLFTW